ncbi:putative protein-lysine deacylase ABHD14B [Styela clava]
MASKSILSESGEIFYRETLPVGGASKGDILLLHGMKFSSETWLELKTLEKLAEWGYRAVAVDLPEYGNSKSAKLKGTQADFIHGICQKLSINKPVIISPSMSGGFSLPYLIEHGNNMSGYVPVAPVSTGSYINQYSSVRVPTLIVYGDRDATLGTTSFKHLSGIPNHTVLKIPNAGHACYLDQPDVWHNNLRDFLNTLNS